MADRTVALWVAPHLYADEAFKPASVYNRDDCLIWFREFRDALAERGYALHTQDVFKKKGLVPDIVVFNEIPARSAAATLGSWAGKSRSMVLLMEGETILPRNWDERRHREFEALFTWHTEYLGKRSYHELRYTIDIREDFTVIRDLSRKTKFCTMVAGNKLRRAPRELYSKRLEVIRWFEREHPADFDLYGMGWTEPRIRGIAKLRRLGLLPVLSLLFPPEPHSSYRGPAKVKKEIFEQYRFAICFENARDIPGYVTEKLLDAFAGSCVPVYWGAPEIAELVPPECYIDFREFGNMERLYARLTSMSDAEYLSRLDAIEKFMRQQAHGPFGARYSAQKVADVVARRPTP